MGCLPLTNSSSGRRNSNSRSSGSHSSDNTPTPTSPTNNSIRHAPTQPTNTSMSLSINVNAPELVVVSVNENAGASFEHKINAQCYAMLVGAIEPNIQEPCAVTEIRDTNIKRQPKSLFAVRKDKQRLY